LAETKSPTSNTGTWHDPNNAHTDDLNYAYCGDGEGGRTQDYQGYGFAASGSILEARVDVKGYSGDGTKHTIKVYVWDATQWQLVGTITSTTQCFSRQFDASAYINTPAKLNNVKTRIESVGLSAGAPTSRYVRVCWIPVYADWSLGPTETITAKTFPMEYLDPQEARELTSEVSGATITHTNKDFPEKLIKKGDARQLQSEWT